MHEPASTELRIQKLEAPDIKPRAGRHIRAQVELRGQADALSAAIEDLCRCSAAAFQQNHALPVSLRRTTLPHPEEDRYSTRLRGS